MDNTNFNKFKAWSVHIFTASGLLPAFMSIIAISNKDWRAAMAWLIVCQIIDGIDGTLARKFKVKEVLPKFDGKIIDNVIDFSTYAIIPAYFFYSAELAYPMLNLPLSFLILIVSAIYYGKSGMVSEDYYFVGFPVMWNIVVFYLVFIFPHSNLLSTFIVVFFSILHFVPIKFAYPSRATHLKNATLLFTSSAVLIIPIAVWFYPNVPDYIKWIAFINLLYFAGISVFDTFRK